MPLLNRDGEVIGGSSISNAAIDGGGTPLVELERWSPGGRAGVILDVDTEPQPEYASAPLIAIDFPAFNDGRGLSLAVLLRTRFGFRGELRAVGDVHPDLIHYMKRCGFDTFELPDDRALPGGADSAALAPHADYYQASVLVPAPAYRRVDRGA